MRVPTQLAGANRAYWSTAFLDESILPAQACPDPFDPDYPKCICEVAGGVFCPPNCCPRRADGRSPCCGPQCCAEGYCANEDIGLCCQFNTVGCGRTCCRQGQVCTNGVCCERG